MKMVEDMLKKGVRGKTDIDIISVKGKTPEDDGIQIDQFARCFQRLGYPTEKAEPL